MIHSWWKRHPDIINLLPCKGLNASSRDEKVAAKARDYGHGWNPANPGGLTQGFYDGYMEGALAERKVLRGKLEEVRRTLTSANPGDIFPEDAHITCEKNTVLAIKLLDELLREGE